MKKLLCLLLCLILLLTACAPTEPQWDGTLPYTTVSVPYLQPEDYDWSIHSRTSLRFADTGEPIPLSAAYDGQFWATIPQEHKDRPLETYIADKIDFADYDETIWQFWTMEQAVYAGLFPMPEDGIADPMKKMTRQEAMETVLRLVGQPAGWDIAENYELF